jgi:hypothetical protein
MNKMTHYSKYKWQFKSLPYTPVISPKHFMITTDKETKEQIFIFYNVADAEADRLHVKRNMLVKMIYLVILDIC